MEDTLRVSRIFLKQIMLIVLILVLMEDTLRGDLPLNFENDIISLNPCFNGRYSQSCTLALSVSNQPDVLILVLMEDTLRVSTGLRCLQASTCLNPCFNGRYSQRINESSSLSQTEVLILVLMEDTLRDTRFLHMIFI